MGAHPRIYLKIKKKKQSRAEAENSHQANLLQVVQHHHPGIDMSQGVKRPPSTYEEQYVSCVNNMVRTNINERGKQIR